jgi:hypothetical protein
MTVYRTVLVIAALVLGGCANNRYCARDQPYDNARSIPNIQGVDGLTVPDSPTAMRVPPETAPPTPFGVKVVDQKTGKSRYQCLDQPPTLKPVASDAKTTS